MKSKFKINNTVRNEIKIEDDSNESDYIEDAIGGAGIWQVAVASTVSLSRFTALGNMTSIVFLTPVTKFTCIEFQENTTVPVKNGTCYENCAKYAYNSDVMETTVISEFGLICDKAWLQSLSQTILMLGVLFGVGIFGWISDRFGRRVGLIVSTGLNVVSMMSISFVYDFWTFISLRFIIGLASGGAFPGFSMIIEVIGISYRDYAVALCLIPDGLSETFLALLGYHIPIWRNYLFGLSVPCILVFILVCFVPESPRWLVSNGKIDKAIEILERAAKLNKRSTENIKDTIMKHVETLKLRENEVKLTSYLEFLRVKSLRSLTLSTLCVWTVVGTTYYGIYQYVSLISDNVFITAAILGFIQLPLSPVCIVITKLLSRRVSLSSTLAMTGFTMILLILIPSGYWYTDLLGVIGFSASSISFAIVYVYEAELFPTRVRSMAYGLSSSSAKVGAMVAPFIANISSVWIPSAILGGLSLVAAALCVIMPETKGKNLKDISND